VVRSLYSFLQSPTGRILRTVLSIGLVALFVGLVEWSALGELRHRLRWDLTAWAVVLAMAAYPLHGLRWHLLLRAQGLEISHGWTQAVSWIGGFYNSLLLGGVGGDAARAVYALPPNSSHWASSPWSAREASPSSAVSGCSGRSIAGPVLFGDASDPSV
jgi:uncharacterized membrane protein YbhN (UPF0104 family)